MVPAGCNTSRSKSRRTAPSARGGRPALGREFTVAYGQAVWKALAAALVIAASLDALVPRRWLVAALSRPRGPFVAGLLAVPCMMCTCCTAPQANSLRRSGARRASVLQLTWRVTLSAAAAVAVIGLTAGFVLWVIS